MAAHSADLVPSHLKPSDFVLRNATPDNVEKLRITLDYIQAHDLAGTAILKAAWIDGVQIALNNFEESEFGTGRTPAMGTQVRMMAVRSALASTTVLPRTVLGRKAVGTGIRMMRTSTRSREAATVSRSITSHRTHILCRRTNWASPAPPSGPPLPLTTCPRPRMMSWWWAYTR